jgi:hypothetical protein
MQNVFEVRGLVTKTELICSGPPSRFTAGRTHPEC